jgi:hypothetical protein
MRSLSARQHVLLGLDQVDAGLAALDDFVSPAAIEFPTTREVRKVSERATARPADLRAAILELHISLLTKLTAADFSIGTAYGLGRALADTCASSQTTSELANRLESHRLAQLLEWLDDLKSILPDHTAHAISISITNWSAWANSVHLGSLDNDAASATSRLLHAQGQRWRALLSGEKAAMDTLERRDFPSIVRRALDGTAQLGGEMLRTLWAPLMVIVILLGTGAALMVASNSVPRVLTGFGEIAIALGFSWRAGSAFLARLATRIEEPIWEAACDELIGERITTTPPPAALSNAAAGIGVDVTDPAAGQDA